MMVYTLISNQGFGITPIPVETRNWIDHSSAVELRGFFDHISAYRFGCYGIQQRRFELSKMQPMPLPRIEEFDGNGKFFTFPDMMTPSWETTDVAVARRRFFVYFSEMRVGILTSSHMVASSLEMYHEPVVVLEVYSMAQGEQIIRKRIHCLFGAITAYLAQPVHLSNDVPLEPNCIYPLPQFHLQNAGQQIWGSGSFIPLLPGIDRTPRQVMSFVSPKK